MDIDVGSGSAAVEAVELIRVRLPYRRPMRAAHGIETHRDSTIVRWIGRDGGEGWGECAALARPTYDETYADGEWRVLADLLVPALLAGEEAGVVGHQPARSALDVASVDASLRAADRNLAEHLGAHRHRVATMAVVSRQAGEAELIDEVEQLVARGYRSVSVKVTPDDLAILRALRRALPDLELAVDANGSFGAADDAELAQLAELDLLWVEQPVPGDDLVGAARFRSRADVPLALDEPLRGPAPLAAAMALGAIDVANLKPTRLGGVDALRATYDLAVERRLRLLCGGLMECGIGRAYALAVAALPGFTEPTHLGPTDRYFDDDLVEPVELDADGTLPVPSGPGLGVVPRRDVLARHTVDRLLLRP